MTSGKISGPNTSHTATSCPPPKDGMNEKSGIQPGETTQRNATSQHKNGTHAFVTSKFSNGRNNTMVVHEEGTLEGTLSYGQFVVKPPFKTDTSPKAEEPLSETLTKGASVTNTGEKKKSQPPAGKMTAPSGSAKTYAERVAHRGGADEAKANKDVTNKDVTNKEVTNKEVTNKEVANKEVAKKEDNPVADAEAPQVGCPTNGSQNPSNEKKKKKRKKKKKKDSTLQGGINASSNGSAKEAAKGGSSLQYDSWHEVDDPKGEGPSSRKAPAREESPNGRGTTDGRGSIDGSDSLVGDTQRGKDPTEAGPPIKADILTSANPPSSANHSRKNPPDGGPKKKITLLKRNEMKYEKYAGGGNYPMGSAPTGGKNWQQDTSQKTLEQREREYKKIRARIFSNFNKKKNSLRVPDDCLFRDGSNGVQDVPPASHFAMPVGSPYGAAANSAYGAAANSIYGAAVNSAYGAAANSVYGTSLNNVYACSMSGPYASAGTNPYATSFCNHDGHLYAHSNVNMKMNMNMGRANAANEVPPPPPSFYPSSQTAFTSYMYDVQNQSSFSKTGASFPFPIESAAGCYPHYKSVSSLPGRAVISNRGKAQVVGNSTRGDAGKDALLGVNQYDPNNSTYSGGSYNGGSYNSGGHNGGGHNGGTYVDGAYPAGTYSGDAHNSDGYACGLKSGSPPSDSFKSPTLMNHPKQNSLTNVTHVEAITQMNNPVKHPHVVRTAFEGKHFTPLSSKMNQDVCKKNKPPMGNRIHNGSRKKGANGTHNNIIAADVPRQMGFPHGGMENTYSSAATLSGGGTSRRKKKDNGRGGNSSAAPNAYTMTNATLVATPPLSCFTNDGHLWGNINQKTADVESEKGRRIQPGAPPFSVKGGGTHATNQQPYCVAQSAGSPEEQILPHASEEGALGVRSASKRDQKNACPLQGGVPNEGQGRKAAHREGEALPPPPLHQRDSPPGAPLGGVPSGSTPFGSTPLGGALTSTKDSAGTLASVGGPNEGGTSRPPSNVDNQTDSGETKGKKKRNSKRKKKKNAPCGMAKGMVTPVGSSTGPAITTAITTAIPTVTTTAKAPSTGNPPAANAITNGPMPTTAYLQKHSDPLLAMEELEYCRDITLYERRFDKGNSTLESSKRYDVDFPSLY
ncbi:hypothetical protein PVBG_04540 [Plasmodium vivax Brazil I]|uniref:SUZ domain-containing protein n=1 Tax=Plasmodium vivax (strain Brazil I) TaxID=1033975 RepID=A0A0J9T000_PLAV1|nr:hypothetical protein PVBG_04540 [Plasmodium vivax Brazil I]